MPVKRNYKVKGTNDFLVLSAIFFLLCLWAIKDAWFPSEKVLQKHPLEVNTAFAVDGTVQEILVGEGDRVVKNQVLARLRTEGFEEEYEQVAEAYTELKLAHARLDAEVKDAGPDVDPALRAELESAAEEMETTLARVKELRALIDSADLKAPSNGRVLEVLITPYAPIEAGSAAFVIDPKDHFYLFNKSLSILSFILIWVFLGVHLVGR